MENGKENQVIVLEGLSWTRLFCACQMLMVPTKLYRVTHKRAREVIKEELGFCPKGKPGTAKPCLLRASKKPSGFRAGGDEAILDWLGCVHIETYGEPGIATSDDRTLLFLRAS